MTGILDFFTLRYSDISPPYRLISDEELFEERKKLLLKAISLMKDKEKDTMNYVNINHNELNSFEAKVSINKIAEIVAALHSDTQASFFNIFFKTLKDECGGSGKLNYQLLSIVDDLNDEGKQLFKDMVECINLKEKGDA